MNSPEVWRKFYEFSMNFPEILRPRKFFFATTQILGHH